ncbi:MAG: GcrA family cell cycle regulator [Pseudomonadota bacterium]
MAWTDERVEQLKKLWNDGLSASQIAGELGGVTRNAVIGKVHRLGLSGRTKAGGTVSRNRPQRAPSQTPRSKRQDIGGIVGNTALKISPDANPETLPQPRPRKFEELVIPISERATIMQLSEYTCRWPIGDPMDDDFHFCGRKTEDGVPYCSYHRKVAYQAVSDRRRDKKVSAA